MLQKQLHSTDCKCHVSKKDKKNNVIIKSISLCIVLCIGAYKSIINKYRKMTII